MKRIGIENEDGYVEPSPRLPVITPRDWWVN